MRACRLMIMRGWGPRTARNWSLLYPVVVVASTACSWFLRRRGSHPPLRPP
jgi:hypothetical protein